MNDMGIKLDLSPFIFWFINIRIVKERTGIFNQADTSLITGNIDNSEKNYSTFTYFLQRFCLLRLSLSKSLLFVSIFDIVGM